MGGCPWPGPPRLCPLRAQGRGAARSPQGSPRPGHEAPRGQRCAQGDTARPASSPCVLGGSGAGPAGLPRQCPAPARAGLPQEKPGLSSAGPCLGGLEPGLGHGRVPLVLRAPGAWDSGAKEMNHVYFLLPALQGRAHTPQRVTPSLVNSCT